MRYRIIVKPDSRTADPVYWIERREWFIWPFRIWLHAATFNSREAAERWIEKAEKLG